MILITLDKEEELYDKAKAFNVYGYILKEFAIEEIETCIKNIINNKPYFSDEIASYLSRNTNNKPEKLKLLTKTELKIVKLISDNKTSLDVGEELSISVRTVDKHRSNIVSKLSLDNKPTSLSIWANINKNHL